MPVPENMTPVPPVRVKLLLLTLASRMHPVVEAVQAPHVIERHVGLYPEPKVAVQVVVPTHVPPSMITSSPLPGTEAPVPPLAVPHIDVSAAVMVHVVAHVRNRFAACARSGMN
jgi:hypothetical protein